MIEAESVAADRFPVERATARGFSQAFVRAGEGGLPLLRVHGWPETRRIGWRDIASLADAGFEVIVPDLRGFGDSQAGPDGFQDVVSPSRDLHALVRDPLGLRSVVAIAGSLRTRPPRDVLDTFLRVGTFADGAKFRASLGTYESALSDRRAEQRFSDRVGPVRLRGAGHLLQWEAAELPNHAIRGIYGDLLEGGTDTRAREEVFVALGSNLGEREVHLAGAVSALRRLRGAHLLEVSPVYETDPVGPPEQGPYLNAVARLRVSLAPRALLHRLLEIEAAAGRVRSEPNAPRTLDLDLLFYGERELDEPGLRVPHPRLHQRAFVLEPLRDIAPDWIHPTLHRRVEDLAERVREPTAVRRRE